MMRCVFFLAFVCWSGYAQAGFTLAFDAVSVKISRPPSPGTMPRIECRGGPETKDPELWICRNASLKMLLQLAYSVRAFQVVPLNVRGGPFDIVARVQPGASKDQFRVMVQGFLAERFHLALHWDTEEMPVYDLVVGKGGPKVKEGLNQAEEATPGAETKLPKPRLAEDGYPALPPEFSGITIMEAPNGVARARSQSLHKTMEDLAAMLTTHLSRPVIDKTELKGAYDISLYWELDPSPRVGSSSACAVVIRNLFRSRNGAGPLSASGAAGATGVKAREQEGLCQNPRRRSRRQLSFRKLMTSRARRFPDGSIPEVIASGEIWLRETDV
jgi:uncharacterized protein (TIGR03435 family)